MGAGRRPGLHVGRRNFLIATGAMAVGTASCSITPERFPQRGSAVHRTDGSKPPNIVVIIADDLGFGQLGCYGQQKIKTPNLDRMAAEGIRFTDFYSGSPICAPSRFAMLTGMHTGHVRVRTNPGNGPHGFRPGDRSLGTIFKDAGYRTGLFGKWGFGPATPNQISHPNSQGFDEFLGYITHIGAHDYFPARLWDNQKMVTFPGNQQKGRAVYAPQVIAERAISFLHEKSEKPFLLVFSPQLPHAPSRIPSVGQYAAQPWPAPDRKHAAQISLLDRQSGQIIEQLRALGIEDDTVVLFVSDNGPHEEGGVDPDLFVASGPFRGYKRNLYEGGIRVPLIAWSPKLFRRTAGHSTAHPAAIYDVLPTLADLAGVSAPDGIDGVSLRSTLTGTGKQPDHRYLYWIRPDAGRPTRRQDQEDDGRGRRPCAATRFRNWKLVGFAPGDVYTTPDDTWEFELYDLSQDPGETTDLSADRPARLAEGIGYLRDAWTAR